MRDDIGNRGVSVFVINLVTLLKNANLDFPLCVGYRKKERMKKKKNSTFSRLASIYKYGTTMGGLNLSGFR